MGIAPCTWLALFALLMLPFGQAFAEGSRSLYPNTTNPADSGRGVMGLGGGTVLAGVVSSSQFLYVYARQGEYILLGSSNVGTAAGQGQGDIYVYNPQSFGLKGNEWGTVNTLTIDFKCSSQAGKGTIADRTGELAGPSSADGSIVKGYAPCYYTAPSTGIYGVRFTTATASLVANSASLDTVQILSGAVSAWDVTVRKTVSDANDLNARVFAYAWTVSTGGNGSGRRIYNDLYYASSDGYRYTQTMRGLDPNSAAFYANASGFLDTNGTPLYHDFRGANAQVTGGPSTTAGVTAQAPQYPIFFSDIAPTGANAAEVNTVLSALAIPQVPPSPQLGNPAFVGNVTGHTSTVSAGGAFTFTTVNTQTYEIVVSLDGVNFDPANTSNRVLTGIALTGSHSVLWDGKDNNGIAFPAGTYSYRIVGRNGEIHFPMLDVEGNVNGGPTLQKLNGSQDSWVYYDDRGYKTANGASVGTLNGNLCGGATVGPVPSPVYSLLGIDSVAQPTYRTWLGTNNPNTDCSAANQYFGDAKGLDLWGFEKTAQYINPIVIVPPTPGVVDVGTSVSVTPSVLSGATAYGSFVFYNSGAVTAAGVTYAVSLGNTGVPATCPAAVNVTLRPAGVTATYNPAPACNITFTGMPTTLTSGQSLAFNFNYVVAASNPGPIPITTTIAATNETAGQPAPNTATAQTVVAKPIVTVVKSANPAAGSQVNIGDTITYTLSVTVDSAPLTSLFSMSDTLGTGLTFGAVSNASPAFTCSGSLTCTLPSGTATGTYTVTYTATVNNTAVGSVANNVTPSGGGVNPPACNPCSVTQIVAAPKLTILKTASAGNFIVGQMASYTLKVTNTGTTATTAVSTITDVIPTGLTLGTMPPGCTASGQTVTCTIAAGLATGAANAVSFIIPVTPAAAAGSSVTNTASVIGGGDPGCAIATDCPSSVTTPINAPKLTILKTASAANFIVGQAASYTLKVTNTGTIATTAVSTITDVIPTGLTIGTLPAGCTNVGQTVTCTIAAGLATGAANAVSFIIPVTPTAAAQPSVTNTASVIGGGDPSCALATDCPSTVTTTIDAPKLTILKTASASSFVVGQAASYTLKVTNTGTTATTAISTITDAIPTGLTLGTLPAGCTNVGQTVTCTIAAGLATGAANAVSFIIPVTPTAAAQPSVANTANVIGGGDPGCLIATDCPSSVTTMIDAPKLTILKTASASSFVVGQAASYTLKVTNTGTTATTAVSTITDVIPTGLTLGTMPAGCAKAGQTVTCTIAAGLATGAANAVSFIIPVTPTAAAGSSATNIANVIGGGDPACVIATDCPSSVTTPIDAPKLTILKTASAANFVVGQAASYTLKVTNAGTIATTAAATITDVIPTDLTLGTLPAGCTGAGQTVTCTIAAGLATGAANAVSFIIPVTPTAAAQPSVTNMANVIGGGDPSCALATDCPSAVTTPIDAPKLTILKTASAASFVVGQAASYTLKVTNTGTIATIAVATVTDVIPTGLTLGTMPAGCAKAGQTVTCTIAAGLATGAANAVSFIIPVTPTSAAGTSATNTANVIGGGDPGCAIATDCPSSVTTPIDAPKLTILKTASAANFVVGQAASYTLKVTNTGTTATTAVSTITDVIPTGLTLGTLPAGCTNVLQTVTCTIPAGLATGAANAVSFIIPVTPTAAAQPSVTNTASVIGGGDPACVAVGDCDSTVVTPMAANVSIAKALTAESGTVAGVAEPGENLTYTITLTNTGGIDATGYNLSDAVPANTTFVSASDGGAVTAGVINWMNLTVPKQVGATAGTKTVTVVVKVANPIPSGVTSIANVAYKTGAAPPTCPDPACVVTPTAGNVTITKALTSESGTMAGVAEPGENLTYTITLTNTGGADVTGYGLSDALPSNTTFVSASDSGAVTAGVINWPGLTVPKQVGATAGTKTVTVVVKVATPIPAGVTSIANVAYKTGSPPPTCPDPACVVTPTSGTVTIAKALTAESGSVPGVAEPGENLTYTITLTNTGGADVSGYGLSDALPANTAFVSASDSGAVTAGVINWTNLTVPKQVGATAGTKTVTVMVKVANPIPAGVTSIANVAYKTGTTPPTCPDPACVTTPTAGTVTIVKTLSGESGSVSGVAEPAETLTYSIKLSNSGGSDVTGYGVTDSLDLHTTYVSSTNAGSYSAGKVTWTGLVVPASSSLTLTVVVTVDSVIPAGVTRIANLVYQTGATPPTCPPAGPQCVVTPTAGKVSIVKALAGENGGVAGVAEPGEQLTYTITLSNGGGSAVSGYGVTDKLDANTTFVSATNGGTNAAGVVTWAGLTIPANGNLVLTVVVTVNTPIPVGVTHVANLAYETGTTPPSCTTSGPQCVITPTAANISVTKALSGESITADGIAEPGELLTYTITVRNDGGTATVNTIVNETVPLHTTFVSGTPTWTCAVDSPGGTACTTLVNVPADDGTQPGVTTALFTVKVDDPLPVGVASIANAVALNDGTPPDCVALPSQPGCVVVSTGNVSLVKTVTAVTPTGPSSYWVSYLIEVSNVGGSAATYTLTDTLGFPAQGVLFTGNASVTTVGGTLNPALAGGQFNPANGVVVQLSASNISVAAGAIHRYTVKVPVGVQPSALQGGTCTGAAGNGFYNAAGLSGSFNLQSAACAPVNGDIALIHLVKTVTLGQDFNGNHYGDVGDVLDYTFTISNPGTVPLTTVQLFDPRVASLQCDPITATGAPIRVLRGDELFSNAFESVVIPGTLIPGDSVVCRATWALTATDVARRQVVNSATATATGPAGQAVTSTATAIYTSFR